MDKKNILNKIANITKLKIDDKHRADIESRFDVMLDLGNKLNRAVNNNVEISSLKPLFNIQEWMGNLSAASSLRVDNCCDKSNNTQVIIENAPDSLDVFITVPKVIE